MIGPGRPEPLGVTAVAGGANVAIPSAHAEAVELCLFEGEGADEREVARHRLPARTGDVHHGFVPGMAPGARYGLRVHGPWALQAGHRFNPAKLLVDPWATRLDRPFRLDPRLFDAREHGVAEDRADSAPVVPKAILEPAERMAAPVGRAGRPDWGDLVIYELHVKGFTALHPAIPPEIRGTYAALGHPAAIEHLVRLGVTAVEILPSAAWIDERHLPPLGLANYWGYNPMAFLAPDPRLAPGGWNEIRGAVGALQEAGFAVLLDVVLNHTGESDRWGPTISFRGLDNATWYRLVPGSAANYVNDAGCGNVLALDRAPVLRHAMDALRLWAERGGFDGFRYDLATVLGRRPGGFDAEAPLLAAIGQDPTLRDLIHVAEPWDIGPGGHRLGQFPAGWGEWNDRFRDTVRRFWRGDAGRRGDLATRLAGSADVFGARHRPPSRSVNFVTAHDGFTLADLVAYTAKRNHANGEDNRDGTDDNLSWNGGVEGPSDDPAVRARRARDVRALLATLILARGTPMLSMGDEFGRSQHGNNNAYAQDTPLSWLDWSAVDRDRAAVVAGLIALRRAHPALSADRLLSGAPVDGTGIPDVEWRRPDGRPLAPDDWNDPEGRTLVAALYQPGDAGAPGSRVVLALQAGTEPVDVVLPHARDGRSWTLAFASERDDPFPGDALDETLRLAPRSVAVIVEATGSAPGRAARTGVEDGLLDRLAVAAGIAPDWWDIDGRNHRVPAETKTALLDAMGLPATSTAIARDSLARLAAETGGRALPHTLVVREGEPARLRLGPALATGRAVDLVVEPEEGPPIGVSIGPDDGRADEETGADGRVLRVRWVSLPGLPLGRHRIRLVDAPETVCHWSVVPERCFVPDDLAAGGRAFGVAAHLYTLRGEGDQGVGDFSTLATLAERAAGAGAATLGLNPIHALFDRDRDRASPYHPADRRFLDPIYIDVTRLPPEIATPEVRAALEAEAGLFQRAREARAVDYPEVWAAKRRVLAVAFIAFELLNVERGYADGHSAPLPLEFHAFGRRHGTALRQFALWEAIADLSGTGDWRTWPVDLARPDAPGIAAFLDRHETRVRFSLFQQFVAEKQLAEADRAGRVAGLSLGFYRDLAVGCAPDGSEAWSGQDSLMTGVSIGAPPDPFAAGGQVWNLPAPNPLGMRREGYAGFARLLEANMAHAGALRIDHVLGLKRLFLVPEGASGADGAYLAQPFEDLIGQVALESRRARTLVVGEDLGTVPEGFREKLDGAGMLSYRVLWFERDGAAFTPPDRYPAQAAACVSTHDLPTLAGWWSGLDLDEDLSLGRLAPEAEPAARAARERDRAALLDTLARAGLVDPGTIEPAGPLAPDVIAAIHAYVAATPCALALVQADDLAGATTAVNLPGTDRERPNWRRRLDVPVEHLVGTELAATVLAALRRRTRT